MCVAACEDVRCGGLDLHGVLGPLPHLLHLLLPQPGDHEDLLHQSRLPGLLLAGHGHHLCQPHHLLLDEQAVPSLLQHDLLLPAPLRVEGRLHPLEPGGELQGEEGELPQQDHQDSLLPGNLPAHQLSPELRDVPGRLPCQGHQSRPVRLFRPVRLPGPGERTNTEVPHLQLLIKKKQQTLHQIRAIASHQSWK